jgi:hypothetical protein
MATYSQKDYVTGLQPTKPNLQFNLQLLQASESAYKTNKRKVSDLYGSILDSEVSRTENKEAKQEFFKQISQDLRTLGTMDFSLDSNVEQATGMFKSFYSNKYVLNDIVWTEKFNSEYQKGQTLKGCIDPEKCGGQWWEEGDKYMAYKKQEFLNASRDEALGMDAVEYIPYVDVSAKAQKIAKEKWVGVKHDAVSGNYIVTTKNGETAVKPFSALFGDSIGNDPNVKAMFKAQSYVKRMDEVQMMLANGEAKTFEEAQVLFHEKNSDQIEEQLQEKANELSVDLDYLDEKVAEYETMAQNGTLKEGSKEHLKALEVIELRKNLQVADQYLELAENARISMNNQAGLNSINDAFDTRAGINSMFDAINNSAKSIAMASEETELKESEFAKMRIKHQYDVSLEQTKLSNKKDYALWKKKNGISDGDDDGDGDDDKKAKDTQAIQSKIDSARKAVNDFDFNSVLNQKIADEKLASSNFPTGNDVNIAKWKKAHKAARQELVKLKQEANAIVLQSKKKGVPLPYPDEVLNYETLNQTQKDQVDNFWVKQKNIDPTKYNKWYNLNRSAYNNAGFTDLYLWNFYKKNNSLNKLNQFL